MGVRIMVLDPTPGCPASSVAAQIVGSFRDSAAVKQIAQLVRFCRQTSSILTGSNAGWPTANSRLRMSATCPVTRSQPGCQSMFMAVQCKICHPHVNVGLLFESSVSAMQCRLVLHLHFSQVCQHLQSCFRTYPTITYCALCNTLSIG